MKKFFALLLALALFVLPITACDNGSSPENGTTTTPPRQLGYRSRETVHGT